LVIALRTERFGEFFGYLHFGASVITDVKQYFLQGLDRGQVSQAIALPTLKEEVRGHKPPFAVYGFEYEPGLIDRIVMDLFAAPPSGGILPLMQVVCRGLYNEVRDLAGTRTITKRLYDSGGGVSGRVDKQIGQSLQAAIKAAQPSIRDIDEEERKWRTGLYKFVRTQPDGTVGTDLKTEEATLEILKSVGITKGIPTILGNLTQPDILVLRSFEVTSISGSDTTLYCLGHDAVGLVLRQWMLREEEAQKRRLIEMLERRRVKFVKVVGVLVFVIFVGAVLVIGSQENYRKIVEVSVLQSSAQSLFRDYPGIAAAAAIDSSLVAQRVWWNKPAKAPQATLASIAAALPKYTFQSNLNNSGGTLVSGFVLPMSKKFLFWSNKDGIEIVSWNGLQRWTIDPSALFGQGWKPSYFVLNNAIEAAPALILLEFVDFGGEAFVSIVRDDQVLGTYDTKYFLRLSADLQSLFDKEIPAASKMSTDSKVSANSTHLRLIADAGIVYLVKWTGDNTATSVTVLAFFLEDAKSRESVKFRVGGWVYDQSADTADKRVVTIPPGIAVVSTFMPSPTTRGGDDNLPKGLRQSRALADVTAYDLREESNKRVWSIGTVDRSAVRDCLNRVQDASSVQSAPSDACVMHQQDRDVSGFLLIDVPPKISQSNSTKTDDSGSGTLVAVDVEKNQSIDIDIDKLMQSSLGAALGPNPRASARQRLDFSEFAVGGTYDSIVFAVLISAVIDVFRIESGQPRFVGTYTASTTEGKIFFTPDGQTMLLMSGNKVLLWDISEPINSSSEALAKSSSQNELIQIICKSGLSLPTDSDTWRKTIGLDIPLINPCGIRTN
jgi:hypothetical protein